MHYHVDINGETPSWAHIGHDLSEATRIEADSRMSEYRRTGDVILIRKCDTADCGDYLDLVAFEEWGRALLDLDVLDREHARMVIESDGHGPV
jgi:hypothetical protein